MTAQEASVLMRCVEAGKSSPGRLAVLLGRDRGMVTRFVDRLEARHLVKREINRRDRRYSVITPTGKGKKVAGELASVFGSVREELFAGVVESDIRLLNGFLPQLRKNAIAMGSRKDVTEPRLRGRITAKDGEARVRIAPEKRTPELGFTAQGDDANTLEARRVESENKLSVTNFQGQESKY